MSIKEYENIRYQKQKHRSRQNGNQNYKRNTKNKYGNLNEEYDYRKFHNVYKSNRNDRTQYYSPRSKETDEFNNCYRNQTNNLSKRNKEALQPRNRKARTQYNYLNKNFIKQYEQEKQSRSWLRYKKPENQKYDLSMSNVSVQSDYYSQKKSYLIQNSNEFLAQSNVEMFISKDYERLKYYSTSLRKNESQKIYYKQRLNKNYYQPSQDLQQQQRVKINNYNTKNNHHYFQMQNNNKYQSDQSDQQRYKNKQQNRFIKKKYHQEQSKHSSNIKSSLNLALSKSKLTNSNSKLGIQSQNQITKFKTNPSSPRIIKDIGYHQKNINKCGLNDFRLGNIKGKGKFGIVFMATHKLTGSLYAIKKISKQTIREHKLQDQLSLEIKLQYFSNHPNILKLYSFFNDNQNVYLVLEYMQQGTLYEYLQKRVNKLSQKQVAIIIKQISTAIKYLHSYDIVHRDIKPQNIVMSNGVSKLCDFGWATRCTDRRKTYCGTFDYAAPEIFEGKQYDQCVDLWCLGILTFQLLTGKVPFYHTNRKQSMKKILRVDQNQIMFPQNISQNGKNFVQSLIKKNPSERITANQILNHPFLINVKEYLY